MIHRRGGTAGPYLQARAWLLAIACVLAIVGVRTEIDLIVNLAIGVAVLGIGLRFVGRGRAAEGAEDDDGGE
jgi:hypothetical protein